MLMKPPHHALEILVRAALDEDAPWGDLPRNPHPRRRPYHRPARSTREPGILAGEDLFRLAFHLTDPTVTVYFLIHDANRSQGDHDCNRRRPSPGDPPGRAPSLSTSPSAYPGIATQTARLRSPPPKAPGPASPTPAKPPPASASSSVMLSAAAAAPTTATPCQDAVMAKDNHLATLGPVDLTEALKAWRTRLPHTTHMEVEVDRPDQIAAVLAAGVDTILLDNFTTAQLAEGVRQIDGRALVEASGGITLDPHRRDRRHRCRHHLRRRPDAERPLPRPWPRHFVRRLVAGRKWFDFLSSPTLHQIFTAPRLIDKG